MAVKFVPKRYSLGEIEALKKNPNVLEVRENRLLLTIEFRQQVYEAWIRRPERSTVRRMLEANGFDTQRLGLNFTKSVESVFKRGGRPKFSKASPETQANWAKTIYIMTILARSYRNHPTSAMFAADAENAKPTNRTIPLNRQMRWRSAGTQRPEASRADGQGNDGSAGCTGNTAH